MTETDFDPNNYVDEEEAATSEVSNDGPINPFADVMALMGDDFNLDNVPDNASLVPDGVYTGFISDVTSDVDQWTGHKAVTVTFEITSEDYEGMTVRLKCKIPNGTEKSALVRNNMLSKFKQMYVSLAIPVEKRNTADLRDFIDREVNLEVTIQKFDNNKTGESRDYNRVEWFKLK